MWGNGNDISVDELTDAGLSSIGEMLRSNTVLRHMHLEGIFYSLWRFVCVVCVRVGCRVVVC